MVVEIPLFTGFGIRTSQVSINSMSLGFQTSQTLPLASSCRSFNGLLLCTTCPERWSSADKCIPQQDPSSGQVPNVEDGLLGIGYVVSNRSPRFISQRFFGYLDTGSHNLILRGLPNDPPWVKGHHFSFNGMALNTSRQARYAWRLLED